MNVITSSFNKSLKTVNGVISDKVFAIFVDPSKQSNSDISIFIFSLDDQTCSINWSLKFGLVFKVDASPSVFGISMRHCKFFGCFIIFNSKKERRTTDGIIFRGLICIFLPTG